MFLLPKVEAVNKAKLKLFKMYYNFESSRYYINTVQILINFTFEKSLDMIIPMEKNRRLSAKWQFFSIFQMFIVIKRHFLNISEIATTLSYELYSLGEEVHSKTLFLLNSEAIFWVFFQATFSKYFSSSVSKKSRRCFLKCRLPGLWSTDLSQYMYNDALKNTDYTSRIT